MKILAGYADWNHSKERSKQNEYGGIGYYRTVKIAEQLSNHDVRIVGKEITHYGNDLESQWDTIFKEFDMFFTNYFADDRAGAAIIYYAQKHKKKFVLDIDDNYLDVPESNLVYDTFRPTKSKRAFLSTILSFADAITTSTEPLKERIHGHIKELHGIDKPIFVIPNMNDVNDWDFPITPPSTDKFIIGYSGSNSHHDDLRMVMPQIAQVMKKHKHVHFELIGAIDKKYVKNYFGHAGFDDDSLMRIHLLPATATFKQFPAYLLSRGWNVGIAPLVDTPFTRAKSHIKWMEYSMAHLPTVASRVYPYYMELCGRDTIRHRETGYLCKPHEWFDTLDEIISDPAESRHIGDAAYEYIRESWQYDPKIVQSAFAQM
jgi:glycosyltransferase involved in cell wall biosynthesis